jgi:hypothetical protein
MATIKKKLNGSIILKNGKVSCDCCGCCNLMSYDMFFKMYAPEGCNFFLVGIDSANEQAIPPFPNLIRDRHIDGSCVRGVCLNISNGNIIQSQVYGGPSTSGRDLVQLVFESFSNYLTNGCYAARITFWGWIYNINYKWALSSDTKWKIELYKLECEI